MIEIKSLSGDLLFSVDAANLCSADLRGADLRGANLRVADLRDGKITSLKMFTGLYTYTVWSVLFEDRTRWVKMGCLFYPLEKWDTIGIKNSNISEYPDDGSKESEERARAFEFAKIEAMHL